MFRAHLYSRGQAPLFSMTMVTVGGSIREPALTYVHILCVGSSSFHFQLLYLHVTGVVFDKVARLRHLIFSRPMIVWGHFNLIVSQRVQCGSFLFSYIRPSANAMSEHTKNINISKNFFITSCFINQSYLNIQSTINLISLEFLIF